MAFVVRASVTVAASPEQVWAVLTDLDEYPRWNPFTTEVRTSFEVGTPVVMRVRFAGLGTMTQREVLREVTPPRRLVWAMDIGWDGLIGAERVQTLTPVAGGTRYDTVDTIVGVLAPVVRGLLGRKLQRGFQGVCDGLATEVQSRAGRPGDSSADARQRRSASSSERARRDGTASREPEK